MLQFLEILNVINNISAALFFVCYAYQIYYIVASFIIKPKPHVEPVMHNFAVLISARNEEPVIGELIDSLKTQTYPAERITVFVVADNCSDNTAAVAEREGATVYVREDLTKVGKGYALEFLIERINEDYPRDAFDAFFVFDADNVLEPNYIEEMNKTYSDGYRVVTSYRNSKNYGDNWISAGYGLWFLREAKYLNGARMLLGTSCAVSGTGFMFDRSVIGTGPNGEPEWKYFLLTEDIEFSTMNILNGEKIGYCPTAQFYDEQPIKFKQSWNQRLRWAKGYLQVYKNYGKGLIGGMFKGGHDGRPKNNFSCFDMTMTIMPALILTAFVLLVDIVAAFATIFTLHNVLTTIRLFVTPIIGASWLVFIVGLVTTITEWRNIHTTGFKKVIYTITFPIFMLTYIPIAITAIFKKVSWTHIEHVRSYTVDDVRGDKGATGIEPPKEGE